MSDTSKQSIQSAINQAVEFGKTIGRIENINPVKEAEIARLESRIKELEEQSAIVGAKNPAWEAGYQRALYIMPDEIARACPMGDEPSYEELKLLYDTVKGIMRGVIPVKRHV